MVLFFLLLVLVLLLLVLIVLVMLLLVLIVLLLLLLVLVGPLVFVTGGRWRGAPTLCAGLAQTGPLTHY